MAKEEVMLVRNQAFYLGFLDTKQNVAIFDIVHNSRAFGTVFVIRKSADVAGLYYDFMLGKSLVQFRHLFGRQGHAIILRGLGFFDEGNFHYILF